MKEKKTTSAGSLHFHLQYVQNTSVCLWRLEEKVILSSQCFSGGTESTSSCDCCPFSILKRCGYCGQGQSLEAASCSAFCSVISALSSKGRWCFFFFQAAANMAPAAEEPLSPLHSIPAFSADELSQINGKFSGVKGGLLAQKYPPAKSRTV